MKKILCLVIAIMLILTCVGCSDSDSTMQKEQQEDNVQSSMFVVLEKELFHGYWYAVCYHKETKVMYALSQYNEFTVMLDADGKPLLWEE